MKCKSFTHSNCHRGSILGYYTESISFKINGEVLQILEKPSNGMQNIGNIEEDGNQDCKFMVKSPKQMDRDLEHKVHGQ